MKLKKPEINSMIIYILIYNYIKYFYLNISIYKIININFVFCLNLLYNT